MARETRGLLKKKILLQMDFLLNNEHSLDMMKNNGSLGVSGELSNRLLSKEGKHYFLYSLENDKNEYRVTKVNQMQANKIMDSYLSKLSRRELYEEIIFYQQLIDFTRENNDVYVLQQEYLVH